MKLMLTFDLDLDTEQRIWFFVIHIVAILQIVIFHGPFMPSLVNKRRSSTMYRTLPTSMEFSTATNSSLPAKLLVVTQVEWISVAALYLTINDLTAQAEMVAVETFTDVRNILLIFYDCLCSPPITKCLANCVKWMPLKQGKAFKTRSL